VPAAEIAGTCMEIERAGATVLADARTLCGEQVSDQEFSVLGPVLVLGWRALVPPGARAGSEAHGA